MVDLTHSALAAVNVANFPVGLFTADAKLSGGNFVIENDQADYDQAIAVTQDAGNDIVVVAGSLKFSGSDWNASLFRLTITGTAAANDLTTDFAAANQTSGATDPTFIGSGIHPDVHGVTLNGADVWVVCDGGVFRRSAGVARSLNAGLADLAAGLHRLASDARRPDDLWHAGQRRDPAHRRHRLAGARQGRRRRLRLPSDQAAPGGAPVRPRRLAVPAQLHAAGAGAAQHARHHQRGQRDQGRFVLLAARGGADQQRQPGAPLRRHGPRSGSRPTGTTRRPP